jgi:hypothetical protein
VRRNGYILTGPWRGVGVLDLPGQMVLRTPATYTIQNFVYARRDSKTCD